MYSVHTSDKLMSSKIKRFKYRIERLSVSELWKVEKATAIYLESV